MRFGCCLDIFNGSKIEGQGQNASTGNHLSLAAAKIDSQGGEDHAVEAVDCRKPVGVDFYNAVAGAYNTDLALVGSATAAAMRPAASFSCKRSGGRSRIYRCFLEKRVALCETILYYPETENN